MTFESDGPANEKHVKKIEPPTNNELRTEYDLGSLRVRKLGSGRKGLGGTIRLEPDVAEIFPDADAVNDALRFLIRVTQEKKLDLHDTKQ